MPQNNTSSSWVDYVYSSTIYAIAKVGGFYDVFTEVSSSSSWGILSPSEDDRICDKYGDCVIPFHGCTFSVMSLCLSFTAFEIEVLEHLEMGHSQLLPASWVYAKVYKYWCEYLNKESYVILFFHLLKCHRGQTTWTRCE